jgi:hypothetical protein
MRPIVWKAVAAAAVVALLFFKLELTFEGHQLVVRWGRPPADEPVSPNEPQDDERNVTITPVAQVAPALERRVSVVSESLHVLSDVADTRERALRAEMQKLRLRLAHLERQSDRNRLDTERAVAALYTAHFRGGRLDQNPGDNSAPESTNN